MSECSAGSVCVPVYHVALVQLIVQYEEEESWEEDRATSDSWKPLEELGDFCDKTCDWFEADDPALFSDEFSDPEDWGFS